MKLIKKLIWTILIIVLVVLLVTVGGYIFVRVKYNIDLYNSVKALKTINEKVDESTIAPNAITSLDIENAKEQTDMSVPGLIFVDGEGNYHISMGGTLSPMTASIKLADNQVAAIAENILQNQMNGAIKVGSNDVKVNILQISFSNVADGGATVNMVIKLDLKNIKQSMNKFPFTLLKKFIPDTLYISSTFNVSKTGNAFEYTVSHNKLTLNKLTAEETADTFKTLDVIAKVGSVENFNKNLGTMFMDALVGTEGSNGLAYSLKALGATDYTFETISNINYFIVQM